ncbi:MAG: hypothetical protein IPI35_28020 [Deltaproteobacteria bacterium]|nr:hypothetical protein [Deltaproteobacteria bacterium]
MLGELARRLVSWAGERPGWSVEQGLIFKGRDEVLTLRGPEGHGLRLRYDQSQPELSWRVAALKAYLGLASRARPDISVLIDRPGRPPRAVLIEVKLSDNLDYIKSGFDEAIVYREENQRLFADETDWPQTILVTSRALLAEPRQDKVIAVDWRRWCRRACWRASSPACDRAQVLSSPSQLESMPSSGVSVAPGFTAASPSSQSSPSPS